MDRLPTELITQIISYLRPGRYIFKPPTPHDWLTISLLNREFRQCTQRLLFERIHLQDAQRSAILSDVLESRSDLAAYVRRLDLDRHAIDSMSDAALEHCSHLEHLRLCDNLPSQGFWQSATMITKLEFFNIRLDAQHCDLPSLPNLQEFNLANVWFETTQRPQTSKALLQFPSLRHILIHHCQGAVPTNLLRSPSLSTLNFRHDFEYKQYSPPLDLSAILHEIFPTLDALHFVMDHYPNMDFLNNYRPFISKPNVLVQVSTFGSWRDSFIVDPICEGVKNFYFVHGGPTLDDLLPISVAEDEALTKELESRVRTAGGDGKVGGTLAGKRDISFIYEKEGLQRVFLSPNLARLNPVALAKSGQDGVEVFAAQNAEQAFKQFTEICKK